MVVTRSKSPSLKSSKRNREDRHKDKHVDHHRRKEGQKNSGHQCICGYSQCEHVMKKFRKTAHVFDRAPIRLCIPTELCQEWEEFFDSLMRNLHVTEEMEMHLRDLPKGSRFDVCAHHFTEEVVKKYWSGAKRRKIWAVRLDRADAVDVLHLPLDDRDRDGNGKYWINANNPMVGAAATACSFHSGRHERSSSRSHHDAAGSDSSEGSPSSLVSEVEDEVTRKLRDTIDQLKGKVVELRQEKRKLQRRDNRKKDKLDSLLDDIKELRKRQEESYTLQDVTDMLVRFGGVNRINLFNKDFHAKHPGAAKCLWGANTYGELLTLVECAFPDVDIDNAPTIHPPSKKRKSPSPLPDADYFTTPLERCLVCRLFFRLNLSQEFIGLLFDKHRTTIGSILKEWAPRWGKFGEQISILDITEDYLTKEEPQRSGIVGVQKTVNVDGTDTKIETSRKDATSKALAYGAKNEDFDARSLNWCTATSLTFEHTRQFLARSSEKAVNEEWGSQGKKKAPLKEWKGVAATLTSKQEKILTMKTATDELFDYHDMEEEINELTLKFDALLQSGAVDDGVLLTATLAEVDEMPGMKNPSPSPAQESRLPPTLTGKKQITMKDIDNWCIEREAMKNVQKKSDKASPVIEAENLRRLNKQALEGGVNSSGVEKLVQLEVHERLHRAYEDKKMTKTILSYYLLEMKSDRHKILKWLGSDLVPDVHMPKEEDLPDIWLRLAKIPPDWDVLGDKGFYKSDRYYPHLNKVRTPWKLNDKKVQQYRRSAGMIVEDRETSDTRVVVEDDYERYRNEKILKGPVQYWQLALLPYAHEWGHATMNLSEPMRRPGEKSSIANSDYWDKHNKH